MAAMVYYHGFWLAVLHVLTNGLTFFQSILSMNLFFNCPLVPFLVIRPFSFHVQHPFLVIVPSPWNSKSSSTAILLIRNQSLFPSLCDILPSILYVVLNSTCIFLPLQQFSLQFIWLVHLRVLHSANYWMKWLRRGWLRLWYWCE